MMLKALRCFVLSVTCLSYYLTLVITVLTVISMS